MAQEYVHQPLNQEVTAIGGHYQTIQQQIQHLVQRKEVVQQVRFL